MDNTRENTRKTYDVIIIGAGHSGCEAAHACAKLGQKTLMITLSLDNIGFMPCNPSIGGTAKGHLVCEVDALGGIMGIVADKTALQMRMLNEGKGSAVAALRAQIDKDAYHKTMRATLEATANLTILEDEVTEILWEQATTNGAVEKFCKKTTTEHQQKKAYQTECETLPTNTTKTGNEDEQNNIYVNPTANANQTECVHPQNHIIGVKTQKNGKIKSSAVVVATGVYLQSKTFIGDIVKNEGPSGFPAANGLTQSLVDLGLEIRRFKTGTPARIDKHSVNFAETQPQYGDDNIRPFSFVHSTPVKNVALCHLTYTNPTTHQIIRDNIKKSAMYGGLIVGIGPRYCPSIEDKVMRFADRNRHQIFLEPETENGDSIYLQGMSTSLPHEIQHDFIQTIDGLHNAQIIKCGYAIEYDCINSLQLLPTLEYKKCKGLFFAGQINGTSGYEEAAAQGLLAGINAGLYCKNTSQNTIYSSSYDNNNTNFTLSRTNSYIGVLVDDLTTVGTNEPYRMFTARAEHRLFLRQDNADERLTPIGRNVGTVDDERWEIFQTKQERLNQLRNAIDTKTKERLRKPNETLSLPEFPKNLCDIVTTEIKYEGYLAREAVKINETKRQERTLLSPEFDYTAVGGLRKEAQIKLNQIKPLNIGQAGRISGVTPADIGVLLIYLKQQAKK